jgi:succinate dehydrogenase/fumarate reductase flavoprotein subunit
MKSVVQNIQNIWFETDVLIIGGGAAATMAAFECAEAGVRSIQVTKGKATSGTTTVARGGFAAAAWR